VVLLCNCATPDPKIPGGFQDAAILQTGKKKTRIGGCSTPAKMANGGDGKNIPTPDNTTVNNY